MIHFDDTAPAEDMRPAQLTLRQAVVAFAAIALLATAIALALQTKEHLSCLASLDRGLTLAQADTICGKLA